LVTVIQQLAVLYLFIGLGWLFGKRKPVLISHTELLSYLAVNLLLPCKVFKSFSQNFTTAYIREHYVLLLAGLGLLLLLVGIALLVSGLLTKNAYEQRVCRYSITIANYAYMGYVLAEELMGASGLTCIILFCIPFAFYTYSFGYILLTGQGKFAPRRLVNPMTVAILLGCVWGLTELPLPLVAEKVISSASACVGPLSMLLTGLTLSGFRFRELINCRLTYLLSALRLVLIPLLVFSLFSIPLLREARPYAVLMACMPCGLNTIIFPKLVGEDCTLGARLAFVSHLLSCITLPIWLTLIN